MPSNQILFLSHEDYQTIQSVLSLASAEVAEFLEEELNRAAVLPREELPEGIIALGDHVHYVDLETKKEFSVVLGLPHETDVASKKISVLSPIGAALIGLKKGDVIQCPMKNDQVKNIRVLNVESALSETV